MERRGESRRRRSVRQRRLRSHSDVSSRRVWLVDFDFSAEEMHKSLRNELKNRLKKEGRIRRGGGDGVCLEFPKHTLVGTTMYYM